jgi:hypothetical protein
MNIESAKYVKDMDGNNEIVNCVIDGVTMSVPLNSANRHYAEIMKQVEEGTLTIAEADG